jgi:2-iminobutanoate/2-iminopropanoate deaminase
MEKEAIVPGEPERWKASYSPAVSITPGRLLFISGQVAFDENGKVVGVDDIVVQARQAFENLRTILMKAGADFSNVVKTNYYVTDVSQFSKVAALRTEYFRGIYPASTMIEVKGLVHKDLMIEIEAVASLE